MKSLHKYIIAVLILLATHVSPIMAQNYSVPKANVDLSTKQADELWNMANTAYANSNFIDAERYYSEILSRGEYSADLYYNLGNVHHKRGELGRSLLYYYKALRLAPADEDILHNIEIVETNVEDNIERVPSFFLTEWSRAMGRQFSCMEWSVLSIIFFVMLLGSLLLYLLSEVLLNRRIGFWSSLIFATLFFISFRYGISSREELMNPSEAIVMSKSLPVVSSPSEEATELFILHEGTKMSVVTRLDRWCEVMIDDGKKGWVECSKIQTI